MKNIQIGGDNSGQINVVDNRSKMTITDTVIRFVPYLDMIKTELEQLLLLADDNTKTIIEEALDAVTHKDESKFKTALKKASSFINNFASNIAASILVEYMKQNGLS